MATLTVIVLTLNEERNIAECLETVRWADQIILVDSGSTDRTVELAGRYTSRILTVAWRGYGAARNAGLDHSEGDWILWLDADERVPPELAAEIRGILASDTGAVAGFQVARRAYFCGKWIRHCGWYPSRVTRLFRKGTGRFSETNVHEQLVLGGAVRVLQHDLLHFTDPDLRHYFGKFNTYTSLAAQDMRAAGRKFHMADIILRPAFQFLKMYVVRLGFLDGIHGFILCVASSAYVFTKYAKLWELSRNATR